MRLISGAFLLLVTIILISGCGRQKDSGREEDSAAFDSVEMPAYSGNTAIGVTQSVKDFAQWKQVFDSVTDPAAVLSIFASPDDPQLVTVFELTHSHQDAKKHFHSADLMGAMDRAGVTSEPQFRYYDIKFREPGPTPKIYRVAVSHEVEDYDKWKKVFDEDEPIRSKANLELRAISVDADDPHLVNIMFATDNIDKAKEVINSDELRRRMKEAGVVSEPLITVLKVAGR